MTAPKGHKVVTVERGDGYAARCTVVVDGLETLCGITFGGFDTRTEAREALRHEEAPGAVAAAVGGTDQNPTIQEEIQNMNIIPETEEARQAVREWAAELAQTVSLDDNGLNDYGKAPKWPEHLNPWWARKAEVTYIGGGEAMVQFVRSFGETQVSALVTVVVSDAPGWVQNHPDSAVGDVSEDVVEVTIVGPHEGMSLMEAEDVSGSLMRATAMLQLIHDAEAKKPGWVRRAYEGGF